MVTLNKNEKKKHRRFVRHLLHRFEVLVDGRMINETNLPNHLVHWSDAAAQFADKTKCSYDAAANWFMKTAFHENVDVLAQREDESKHPESPRVHSLRTSNRWITKKYSVA